MIESVCEDIGRRSGILCRQIIIDLVKLNMLIAYALLAAGLVGDAN